MARTTCLLGILLLLAATAAVAAPAHAEKVTIPLGYSIYGLRSDVEAHLLYVEVDDNRTGSTLTSTPLDRVKWFRLFYQYENHGNTTQDGDLKLRFYDEDDNEYRLDERTYTGDTVSAHSVGSLKFVELPISRDSNIVKISVIKGFDTTNFTVPLPTVATPTLMPTSTATATAMPTTTPTPTATPGDTGSGCCLPLLPFALVATVGLAGTIAGRRIKR